MTNAPVPFGCSARAQRAFESAIGTLLLLSQGDASARDGRSHGRGTHPHISDEYVIPLAGAGSRRDQLVLSGLAAAITESAIQFNPVQVLRRGWRRVRGVTLDGRGSALSRLRVAICGHDGGG
jgi:hypothetical protein